MTSLAGLTTQVFGAILPFANFNVATFFNVYEMFFGGYILGQYFQMCFFSGEWRFGTITGVGTMHWKSGAR